MKKEREICTEKGRGARKRKEEKRKQKKERKGSSSMKIRKEVEELQFIQEKARVC
jgi:hypothetical protein